jgi:hypothetical protein
MSFADYLNSIGGQRVSFNRGATGYDVNGNNTYGDAQIAYGSKVDPVKKYGSYKQFSESHNPLTESVYSPYQQNNSRFSGGYLDRNDKFLGYGTTPDELYASGNSSLGQGYSQYLANQPSVLAQRQKELADTQAAQLAFQQQRAASRAGRDNAPSVASIPQPGLIQQAQQQQAAPQVQQQQQQQQVQQAAPQLGQLHRGGGQQAPQGLLGGLHRGSAS